MKIRVEINGHQYANSVEGEVLLWCMAVEHYTKDDKSQALQVPAVLLRTADSVELVTLQRHLYWTRIEVL